MISNFPLSKVLTSSGALKLLDSIPFIFIASLTHWFPIVSNQICVFSIKFSTHAFTCLV
jgi:hypothetical protein